MEAPKCQFCGKEEWRHVCGNLENLTSGRTRKGQGQRQAVDRGITTEVVSSPPKMVSKGFDRTAYQREYMRKRRAKP